MKCAIAFFSLGMAVAPAWAGHFDSNPDLEQSILNIHAAEFPPRLYSGMSGGAGGISEDATTRGSSSADDAAQGSVPAPGVRESDPVLGDPDSGMQNPGP